MKITLKHIKHRITKTKMGGQITISIQCAGPQIQSCIFSYGDPKHDYCATRKEAEKAALNYMLGARAMFELMKTQMNLDLTDFHKLQSQVKLER